MIQKGTLVTSWTRVEKEVLMRNTIINPKPIKIMDPYKFGGSSTLAQGQKDKDVPSLETIIWAKIPRNSSEGISTSSFWNKKIDEKSYVDICLPFS